MKIEPYGLDPVPVEERKGTWYQLFFIWAGVSFCLPSFIIGALLVPAFSWYQAVNINFVGNLAVGVLIVVGGYFGTRTGLPAAVFGRRVFGDRFGHWLPTLILLFTMFGWFAVMIGMTGEIISMMIEQATGYSMFVAVIVVVGLLNALTAVFGYHNIQLLSRVSVPLLGIFCLILVIKIYSLGQVSEAIRYTPVRTMTFGEGIDLVIGGYISAALAASDFSRYARSNRHNWLGTLPGTFIVSFLLGLLGMISVAVTGNWNPLLVVQSLGLGIPVLLFVLLANWTTNDNMLYTAGFALTNILPRLTRWQNTLLCGVAGTLVAVMGLVNFMEQWLILLSSLYSPLIGVMLVDFFVIKRWSKGVSINIEALAAVGAGVIFAHIAPARYIISVVGLIAGSTAYITLVIITQFVQRKRK